MKKVNQEQLRDMQKSGATVKRLQKPEAPKPEAPKPETPKLEVAKAAAEQPAKPAEMPGSMRASMQAMEAQAEATRLVVAKNTEVISDFGKQLKTLVEERDVSPTGYTFDIERDEDKLLKRIYAIPGIDR